ncbi:retrovirus-related pol polyprotein from transposon TNT 1-94 [Tanacetum coccineum]
MHNNIMAAGFQKDPSPMLGPGRYSQWRSRFLRYLDTKSNGEYLRKCIFEGPYTPTSVLIAAVEAAENILPVAAHEEAETIHNMTTENKLYFQAEKELLSWIFDCTNYQQQPSNSSFFKLQEPMTEDSTPGSPVVQQKMGYQCFNCKGFWTLCHGMQEAKAVKDYAYHKEKMKIGEHITVTWKDSGGLNLKEPQFYKVSHWNVHNHDENDVLPIFCPNGEETVTLEKESRSKLDKDKKLILVTKGKSVETQFDKPSVVRQPNAQRIPKPSVLGKPTPFSNSPEMRSFQTNKSVNKTNASDGLFKPVTQQNLPQNRNQAVRNTNVLKPGMYRIASTTTQTRTPQLPHASRNTNPHMSKSSGVIHTTSVSRPQLKCYQVKDKVVPNNSQVKFQKKEVEDHHRISSISKKTKSVTACNDSSNSRTSNENAVCAECGTCVFNSNHDACVSRYLKDVNARTKKPNVVPISASKPKRKANKSVATPHKKTVASDTTIQKSKSYYKEGIVQLILFIVDSGCTKHMTGNLKLLCNFVEKFLGTVRFGNDQFAPILGYGDLIQGNVTIKWEIYLFLSRSSGNDLANWYSWIDLYTIYSSRNNFIKLQPVSWLTASPTQAGYDIRRLLILTRLHHLTLKERVNAKEVHSRQKQFLFQRKAKFASHGHVWSNANGVVERRNRTLVEAARTMLSASKLPLSFWAEAVATACYTQNRSIIISTHGKTAYHIINDRKPSIKHLHIFGCIFEGISCLQQENTLNRSDHNCSVLAPQRQEISVENVSPGLVPQGQKGSECDNSDPAPPRQKASDYDNSDPVPPRQNVVPSAEKTDSSQQGLEFLFSPLLEEYYNPTHGQAEENNNDQAPNASFQEAEFINPFCTRVQEIGESSSRNIDVMITDGPEIIH